MILSPAALRHVRAKTRRLRLGWLLVLLAVFGMASALLLRQNNLSMVERRRAVLVADQQNGNAEAALQDLRSYMLGHMNTRMSEPVRLQYSYERAVKARLDAAAASGSATDAAAYQRAQDECRTANTITYAQCVINRTSQIAPGSNPIVNVTPPLVELFSYQFYSPAWSPDAAGWAVLAFMLTLLVLVIRVVAERTATWLLRRSHSEKSS